jgi:hypothetical protein
MLVRSVHLSVAVKSHHILNKHQRKRKSPHSTGKKEYQLEISPTPLYSHGKKSGGKKRHSYSPLVQNGTPIHIPEKQEAPVFSLTSTNDFPPMGQNSSVKESKKNLNRRSSDSNIQSYQSCDTKISRVINFSNNESNALAKLPKNKLVDVKKLSPVTVPSPGPRRITPTVVRTDNSVMQNSAFLVPIEENDSNEKNKLDFNDNAHCVSENTGSHLSKEEREFLKYVYSCQF